MTSFADRSPPTWLRVAASIYAIFLLLLLLSPTPVEHALNLNFGRYQHPAEMAANVLIFLPVGFAAAHGLGSRLRGVAVGIVISTAAEIAQLLWLPERDAAVADILKNAIGTSMGALLHRPNRRPAGPKP